MCWLSEPLPSGLLADAKHRRNLSPGTSVGAGLGDVVGESEIDGSHRMKGRTDGTQVSAVGVGGRKRVGIESVEPRLSVGDGLLELFAGSDHVGHLG